jgi:hypothetical protein
MSKALPHDKYFSSSAMSQKKIYLVTQTCFGKNCSFHWLLLFFVGKPQFTEPNRPDGMALSSQPDMFFRKQFDGLNDIHSVGEKWL